METEENQLELHKSLKKYTDKASQVLPDLEAPRNALRDAVYKDGALSRKVKRLIALGVALGIRCETCIIGQTKLAVEAGATKEEVLEAASVLLAIHGSSGYAESWRVVKILEEMGMM